MAFFTVALQAGDMTDSVPTSDYERYGVSPDRGFVPDTAPLTSLGDDVHPSLARLDDVASTLPERLDEGSLRETLDAASTPPVAAVDGLSVRETRRVYGVCGFLASAYVHHLDAPRVGYVPESVAVPLVAAADELGRTPMLAYDSYVLENWAHDGDPDDPVAIDVPTTFSGLPDEEWFVAVHVAIETTAGPAVAAVGEAQQGMRKDDNARVLGAMETIADAVERVAVTLRRMPDGNDPDVYGAGFRPYLTSFNGVEYRGTDLTGTQSFRGGSGAQSSLFPALDGVLGIDHGDGPLITHLRTLREDMPPDHRAFVEAAESGPSLRSYVKASGDPDLRAAYDECIDRTVEFRELHVDVVETYLSGGDEEGTGGTPYVSFLDGFTEDTREARL